MAAFPLISSLNALAGLLLFAVYGVILLGHARKLSHDILAQTAKDWEELAASRLAINEGLQTQLDAIQNELTGLAGRLAAVECDRETLQRLTQRQQADLERLLAENEALRELLTAAGIPVPEDLRAHRLRGLRREQAERGGGETRLGAEEHHERGEGESGET